MITLLQFSLKRRFKNKMSLFLLAFYWLMMAIIFNLDRVSEFLDLDWGKNIEVVASTETRKWILDKAMWEQHGFVFTITEGDIRIEKTELGIKVWGSLDAISQSKLQSLLLKNHQLSLLSESSESVQNWLDKYSNLSIQFEDSALGSEQIRQQAILFILTSLYFLVLNFIAVNTNEITVEKTSNVLALVLSSVNAKAHFISKLLSALITVCFQMLNSILSVLTLGYARYSYDEGRGLMTLLQKIMNVPIELSSFKDVFQMMNFSFKDILGLGLSLIYVLLGILIVQVLIIILSSRARTSEEASVIQGPFYLFLLALYYASLSFNSVEQLSDGLPYLLSFLPISSMLIMPMRIIQGLVMPTEIIFSLMASLCFLLLIMVIFFPVYRKGLERT